MFSSLFFRIASMILKFVFMLVAAKYLAARDVALFGATNSFVLLAIYLLGLDLYIATSRSIHHDRRAFWRLLSNQVIVITTFSAIFVVVLISFPRLANGISVWLIVPLALVELASQEFYRLQISHGDYIKANVLFFIKTGLWSGLSAAAIYLGYITTIEQVIGIWIFGSLAACLYGWVSVRIYVRSFVFSPNTAGFLRDLRNNVYIFSSSVTLVLMGNMDKVFLGSTGLHEAAAAYVFYASLAGAVMTLIYSGVVNPNYSKLVKADRDEQSIRAIVRQIALSVLGLLALLGLALFIGLDPLLNLIGRPYLMSEKGLLGLLMISVAFNAAGLIPHFYLLGHKRDKLIAIASLAGVLWHLATLFPFFLVLGARGVALSVASGFAIMLVSKTLFALKTGAQKWTAP